MPDDERLGEFRGEFAGMLGTLEEDPSVKAPVTPGFEGFTELVDTDELDELLDADSGARVDSRSFLRARLLDLLIGRLRSPPQAMGLGARTRRPAASWRCRPIAISPS